MLLSLPPNKHFILQPLWLKPMEPSLQEEKGVLIQQRTIPQTHLLVLLYSLIPEAEPGKHQGNCTETRSFSSCQQEVFVFSTQEALRCHTHWQEQCFPLLPSAALEAQWLQQAVIRGFPPKTLPWPRHCGSTQPGSLHKVIIQQNNRESHGKNLLCCWKFLLFHSQSTQVCPLI